MEVTQGNLAAIYTGLKAAFLDAIREAKMPEGADKLLLEVPSTGSSEEYPTGALLGDLEEFLDELPMTNIGEFMQTVANTIFSRGFSIPRTHVEDDSVGMYAQMAARLGRLAATHPARRLPQLFIAGFTTAWVDGANVFSANHVWPGGQAWSNVSNVPLTTWGFEQACQHLMERVGPDGQSMDLTPTHLIVGPRQWNRARRIINRERVGGGNSNIHYDEVTVWKWSRLRGAAAYYWFVCDLSAEQPPPVIFQRRDTPTLEAQTDPTSDTVFYRERFVYKARHRYGRAIGCPWLIQAAQATEDTTTTTAAA